MIIIRKYILGVFSLLMCFTLVACSSNDTLDVDQENDASQITYDNEEKSGGTSEETYEDEYYEKFDNANDFKIFVRNDDDSFRVYKFEKQVLKQDK